jgi:hypothetical protein
LFRHSGSFLRLRLRMVPSFLPAAGLFKPRVSPTGLEPITFAAHMKSFSVCPLAGG